MPPPISASPPTAVIPEMAFVTDMSGECRAGTTPQTVWYPETPASVKMAIAFIMAGSCVP